MILICLVDIPEFSVLYCLPQGRGVFSYVTLLGKALPFSPYRQEDSLLFLSEADIVVYSCSLLFLVLLLFLTIVQFCLILLKKKPSFRHILILDGFLFLNISLLSFFLLPYLISIYIKEITSKYYLEIKVFPGGGLIIFISISVIYLWRIACSYDLSQSSLIQVFKNNYLSGESFRILLNFIFLICTIILPITILLLFNSTPYSAVAIVQASGGTYDTGMQNWIDPHGNIRLPIEINGTYLIDETMEFFALLGNYPESFVLQVKGVFEVIGVLAWVVIGSYILCLLGVLITTSVRHWSSENERITSTRIFYVLTSLPIGSTLLYIIYASLIGRFLLATFFDFVFWMAGPFLVYQVILIVLFVRQIKSFQRFL